MRRVEAGFPWFRNGRVRAEDHGPPHSAKRQGNVHIPLPKPLPTATLFISREPDRWINDEC